MTSPEYGVTGLRWWAETAIVVLSWPVFAAVVLVMKVWDKVRRSA